ncbi:MAG: helix-turn-helix domain-containing protein [Planctomycetes bacterium]|nr:helix-turn-helix domain-containing protein [Planctomycetota bacterium]
MTEPAQPTPASPSLAKQLALALQDLPPLLTRGEAAAAARCSKRSLDRHVAAGSLKSVPVGRKVLILREELGRWLASRPASRHAPRTQGTS